ncbi:retrovirus-related pol polyprotein from transposon TNT 1-94 [Tanacetum coccineum]
MSPIVDDLATDVDEFYRFLKEEMVEDLKYFNFLEKEVESLQSQLETQQTQFSNEIDRLSREYYYADHMNAILGVSTTFDQYLKMSCDYLEALEKYSLKEKDFSKSRSVTRTNVKQALTKPVTPQTLSKNVNQVQKNTNVIAPGMYKMNTRPNQTRTPHLPQDTRKTNKRVSFSTGVNSTTSVSRPQLKSTQLEDRVWHNNSQVKTKEVEDHRRNFKFSNKTSVTTYNDSLIVKISNVKSVCGTCGKCVFNKNHDLCVLNYINGVNSRSKKPTVVHISTRKPNRTVNQSVATPHMKTVSLESTIQKPRSTLRKLYEHVSKTCSWWYTKITPPGYKWEPKYKTGNVKPNLVEIIMFIVDSGCSKNMMGYLKLLVNFVDKFLRTVRFRNDQFAPILRYGDLVQGNVTIKRVYYVEGLNHNLFSVGQFCDADLEVAFRKSTCYVHDLKGIDLLIGFRGTDLYSITLQETTSPNPICLMAKASSSQAWLWHRRLSHLKFDTINLLSKNDIVNGLPKLKFVKDHLCSSCELGKAKRKSFKTKTTPSSKGQLQLLHMDLCGPMMIEIINGKKYVLIIVDDYSRYTWTHFLRSKDETPDPVGLSLRGQDAAPIVRECTFARFMKCNPTAFHGTEGAVELRRWFKKTESVFGISECAEGKKVKEYNIAAYTQRCNELALMCPRMLKPERVIVDAYIWGLTDNIKGEVTSSKPANLNEAVRMAYKLMEQKSQAKDERILEGKKRKWESFQSGNSSGKGNHRDNSRQTLQNNQKQGNTRAMITSPTDGKVSSGSLPLCERCFTRHVGLCTIKCYKCQKIGHKARKVKQEEVGEVRGQTYAIKDAEPKGLNVVTGTFLLNNRYAFVLFDSGSDRSFVDTRFSSMLNIDPVKIRASYEVELADGRVVSTNTILKGCTLNLVNHIFEIDLMPIELGTFDVIIGMDWLVKHDAVIVCGEKVVRIPYGNKMLIVKSDKGVS